MERWCCYSLNSNYKFEKSLQLKFVDGEPFGIIEDYI